MAAANAPIAMREALTVTPYTLSPSLSKLASDLRGEASLGVRLTGFCHGVGVVALLQLTSLGIAPQFVTFTHVTMESERYICVRETSPQNSVVIIDMAMPSQPLRRPITADSALMNPNTRILALKGRCLARSRPTPTGSHSHFNPATASAAPTLVVAASWDLE
jgi:hypothetical protein